MMKQIVAVVVALLLFCPASGFSETKEIIAEGTYNMGDGETPTVAESRALLQAKRTAVEEAGTYVESYSKTMNFQLTVDEIQVLASGIMEVEVLEKKRTVVGDGFNFWIKIKAKVSTDKMEEMAKRVKEKSVVADYKNIQAAYDKSQKEIEELKRQLAGAKGETEKKRVEAKIANDERLLQVNEWFEKGYKHAMNNEYDAAIEAYTSAIVLNPNDAIAYNNRGVVYNYKGQYERAILDYSKAIEINPSPHAYYTRGSAYYKKGQYDRAIIDFNKALKVVPNFVEAYTGRGLAYAKIGQYDRAILDFDKAIGIKPPRDLFQEAGVSLSVGMSYLAIAYYNRGLAYHKKGNEGKAISDYQKACDLGNETGCRYLKKALTKSGKD